MIFFANETYKWFGNVVSPVSEAPPRLGHHVQTYWALLEPGWVSLLLSPHPRRHDADVHASLRQNCTSRPKAVSEETAERRWDVKS